MALRFANTNSVEEFIEDQENENTRKKTQQSVALLKEFLVLRNESRLYIEEILPKELKAYVTESVSLRLERKAATKTMNPAPDVL